MIGYISFGYRTIQVDLDSALPNCISQATRLPKRCGPRITIWRSSCCPMWRQTTHSPAPRSRCSWADKFESLLLRPLSLEKAAFFMPSFCKSPRSTKCLPKNGVEALGHRGLEKPPWGGGLPDVYHFHFFTSKAPVLMDFLRFFLTFEPYARGVTRPQRGRKVEKPRKIWIK